MTYSVLWLLLLVLIAIGYAIWLFSRSDYSSWETILFVPVYLIGRMLWRVTFTNDPPEALKSGAILAANHRSSVDPLFVQLAARRRVHWMVAREYCDHFLFGALLKPLSVIPTNRSGLDLNSTKLAIQLAQEGRLVGMFPEGRINLTPAPLLPIRGGAAMVAIKTGVPVIPLYIDGSPYRREVWSPLLMPARVQITFGQPIYPRLICTPSVSSDGAANSASNDESASTNASGCYPDYSLSKDKSANGSSSNETADLQLEELILRWGKQVVAMSGHSSDFQVQLGSRTRNRSQQKIVG